MYELTVEDSFDAAHCLRGYFGKCEQLHGHTYKVQASLRKTELNETGISIDFRDVKTALKEIIDFLDHKHLNEVPDFTDTNPSAENIAKFIYNSLKKTFGQSVYRVTVWETPTSSASYFEE